jgi:hypothetical protein
MGARTSDAAARNAAQDGLVYDLRGHGGKSDEFYLRVDRFADRVLAEVELRAGRVLDGYSLFVQEELKEAPRSRGEYAMEFLTLGQALRRYGSLAERTPGWAVRLTRSLYRLRRAAWLKPAADRARAAVTRLFMLRRTGSNPKAGLPLAEGLPNLIEWLQATGEFEQETLRLNRWRGFLNTLPQVEAESRIKTAVGLADWFRDEAERALGAYTRGVSRFVAGEYAGRGCREDQIFCGKQAVEYHLNMVAAEVMNRGLRGDFKRTRNKAVLVPACMRGAKAASCKARADGVDLTCTSCDPACAVNRITRSMRALGARVYLVPHSTGFSRWLERWQREPDTGVTAVACILNILPGGYEMRARGIASQCVPLDYPGCGKHWRREGISTGVNEDRLVRIVAAGRGAWERGNSAPLRKGLQ